MIFFTFFIFLYYTNDFWGLILKSYTESIPALRLFRHFYEHFSMYRYNPYNHNHEELCFSKYLIIRLFISLSRFFEILVQYISRTFGNVISHKYLFLEIIYGMRRVSANSTAHTSLFVSFEQEQLCNLATTTI